MSIYSIAVSNQPINISLLPHADHSRKITNRKPHIYFSAEQTTFNEKNPSSRFFITMDGYGRDQKWADTIQASVGKAVQLLKHRNNKGLLKELSDRRRTGILALDPFARNEYVGEELDKISPHHLNAKQVIEFVLANELRSYIQKTGTGVQTEVVDGTSYQNNPFGRQRRAFTSYGSTRSFALPFDRAEKYDCYITRSKNMPPDIQAQQGPKLDFSAIERGESVILGRTDAKWMYPQPHLIPQVWNRVDQEFQKLLKAKRYPKTQRLLQKSMSRIAIIHWYLAETKPYSRGNATIVDAFTKTITDYLGIQVGNWRGPGSKRADNPNHDIEKFINQYGVAPDLEAFCTTLPEFVRNYPFFFDTPPKWKDSGTRFLPQWLVREA